MTARELSPETVECTGCGGEVPVFEAIYLPQSILTRIGGRNALWLPRPVPAEDQRVYCCEECFLASLPEAAKA
jgi:hypothetical protein